MPGLAWWFPAFTFGVSLFLSIIGFATPGWIRTTPSDAFCDSSFFASATLSAAACQSDYGGLFMMCYNTVDYGGGTGSTQVGTLVSGCTSTPIFAGSNAYVRTFMIVGIVGGLPALGIYASGMKWWSSAMVSCVWHGVWQVIAFGYYAAKMQPYIGHQMLDEVSVHSNAGTPGYSTSASGGLSYFDVNLWYSFYLVVISTAIDFLIVPVMLYYAAMPSYIEKQRQKFKLAMQAVGVRSLFDPKPRNDLGDNKPLFSRKSRPELNEEDSTEEPLSSTARKGNLKRQMSSRIASTLPSLEKSTFVAKTGRGVRQTSDLEGGSDSESDSDGRSRPWSGFTKVDNRSNSQFGFNA
ncbi:hypothetical protein BJ742DRAFT_857177 [Cladochytrium replicatum]|nr:hypothetical protein BJ742DRAFT_857177 [Cladochytrium replicatum]